MEPYRPEQRTPVRNFSWPAVLHAPGLHRFDGRGHDEAVAWLPAVISLTSRHGWPASAVWPDQQWAVGWSTASPTRYPGFGSRVLGGLE